jgi:hypothetical protein
MQQSASLNPGGILQNIVTPPVELMVVVVAPSFRPLLINVPVLVGSILHRLDTPPPCPSLLDIRGHTMPLRRFSFGGWFSITRCISDPFGCLVRSTNPTHSS